MTRRLGRWLPLFSFLVLAACGDGGTQPGTPPTALVAVSMPADTVVTGETTDPPLSVRVDDALGNPIEGTPVRFVVVNGEGSLSPGVAVSGSDGVAESRYRASGSPGEARIRADIPSAPNVGALQFTVVAQASDTITLSIVEGTGQRAEVGSQLAIPFLVQAETPQGNPAGGISVVFRMASGGDQSAVLTSDSVLTSSEGRASTLLTLGRASGDYVVSAYATRGVATDTVRFTATATATFEGSVMVDSIAGQSLTTDEEATLHGQGFSPVAAQNDVRIEGVSAEVLSATGSELRILVPSFAGQCLPVREVGVRVLVQGDASNGSMVRLDPSQPLVNLEAGTGTNFRGPEAVECIQFGPSATFADYLVIVGSSDRRANESTEMRLTTRVPSQLESSAIAGSLTPREFDPGVAQAMVARERQDVALRTSVLAGLTSGRARVARASVAPGPPLATVPAFGESLQYTFAVQPDLTGTCDNTDTVITGTVRGVGEHVVLVEDDDAPNGGFGPEEWEALLAEIDQTIVPVATAYFGPYDDIDGNGRVVILLTPQVNDLAPPGQDGIGGFFLPLDLAASGAGGGGLPGPDGELCPASNEAEIIYLAVADPDGSVGASIPVDRAMRNARGLTAHELQHLINAQTRILHGEGGFSAAEEVWLDEGLSSLAEEVAGLAIIEQTLRTNLTYDQVSGTRDEIDAFNSFHISNFFNLSLFMFNPASAPTISGVDFGGAGGLQMRGFAWALLRWLGDQAAGDERVFFRDLVAGGPNADRGIENIERVSAQSWDDMLASFAVALATDDSGFDEVDSQFQVLTWQLRDVFASLNQNVAARSIFPVPFPLFPTAFAAETGALEFDVGASTIRYFTLSPGLDAPALALGVLTPTGARLSETSEPQITIVRIR